MKIAQVCPYDLSRPGGVKNHIFSLTKELTDLGHEVKILAPSNGLSPEAAHIFHFGKNRSLPVSGTRIDLNIAMGEEKTILKSFLKEENFDIIHYHTFWNPVLPFQVWNYSKAKNIATFHDTPKSKWIGKTIMPVAASIVFKMMNQVISVSKTQAHYIGGSAHPKVTILSNGIDLSVYQLSPPDLPELKDGKFNLLFLGRLEPRKGVHFALNAFATLKKQYPDMRLIIAGEGEERATVEKFISNHQLSDVLLLGQVDEQTKLSLLKMSDLFLAPALYGESFGIVLLEAMASGLPMVGFGNEGYLNVIGKEWRNQFPVPGDQEAFTQQIKHMIDHPEVLQKMRSWGLEEVSKYDWKVLVKEVIKVYHQD